MIMTSYPECNPVGVAVLAGVGALLDGEHGEDDTVHRGQERLCGCADLCADCRNSEIIFPIICDTSEY